MDLTSCRVELHLFNPRKLSAAELKHPVAEFNAPNPGLVLDDLMKVVKLFENNVQVTIEGHTSTSTKAGHDSTWEALAADRARLVADELAARGLDRMSLVTVGRPGLLGLNRPAAVVQLWGRLQDRNQL